MNGVTNAARDGLPASTLKAAVPAALALAAVGWGVFAPPLLQDQGYHRFADTRLFIGVANAADTLSNLAFLIVGGLGLAFLQRERTARRSAGFPRRKNSLPTGCSSRELR